MGQGRGEEEEEKEEEAIGGTAFGEEERPGLIDGLIYLID